MVLLGVDIQHRDAELAKIDRLRADLHLAFDQFILLIKVLHELAVGFPGLVGAVEDPFFHPQKAFQFLLIVQNIDHLQIFP